MASSGFFAGGMAEGIASSRKLGIAEDSLAADTGLRTRALDIQEKSLATAERAKETERFDTLISDNMTTIGEIIKNARSGGTPPEKIMQAITPILDSAKQIAARTGRDPAALDAQVKAALMQPDIITAAQTAGTAKGVGNAAAAIAEARALEKAGAADIVGGIKDPKDRIVAEGSLRDDFLKQAQPFITQRDAYTRLQSIDDSAAGDIALVFSYMKILDPGSTVREGEFATVQNSGGVAQNIMAAYNKALTGERLPVPLRTDIRKQSENLYQAGAKQFDKTQTAFAGIAKRQKLNPDNVIIDLSAVPKPKKAEGGAGSGKGNIPPPPAGFHLVQ